MPATKISLAMIKLEQIPTNISAVWTEIAINKKTINILSAIGSNEAPNLLSELNFLARKPSKKSVIDATKKRIIETKK